MCREVWVWGERNIYPLPPAGSKAPDRRGEGNVMVLNLKPGCVVIELPKKANYPLFLYLFLQY